MKNIFDHPNLGTLVSLSNSPIDASLDIASIFHTSYGTAGNIINKIFKYTDPNRSVLLESLSDSNEINREIIQDENQNLSIDIEKELANIVIDHINVYINFLLGSIEKRGQLTKLKSLLIKLLSVGLYTEYDDLIIPTGYEDFIANYSNLPHLNKDYYLSTIDSIRLIDPESKLINTIEQLGNSIYDVELTNINEYRKSSKEIQNIFKEDSTEYLKLVSPNVIELRDFMGLKHTAYVEGIGKALMELGTMIDNEELMSKLNNLIL